MIDAANDAQVRAIVRDELAFLGILDHPAGPNSLADRLRLARKEAGLTQVEAADLLGVTQGTIGATEAGTRKLLPRQLEDLAKAYGKRIVLVDIPKEDS